MLPNTWNQPRFRQDNDPNAHHFYPQDMHSNPAAMQMNVVLQQDAHSGMNAAHSGMGHAHPHLGNAHQSLQPHFHTVLRGPDQPQYKQPPEIPSEAKTPQGKAPMIPPEESALVKKKPSNNGVLVKVGRKWFNMFRSFLTYCALASQNSSQRGEGVVETVCAKRREWKV